MVLARVRSFFTKNNRSAQSEPLVDLLAYIIDKLDAIEQHLSSLECVKPSTGNNVRITPRFNTVYLHGRNGIVKELYGRSRAIVKHVAVIQSGKVIRVIFRPRHAKEAAEVIKRLREKGATVVSAKTDAQLG